MPGHDSVLFLTLRIFSATGGIEKMCRIICKALYENTLFRFSRFQVVSSHDHQSEADRNPYFPAELFTGCHGSKPAFLFRSVRKGLGKSHVILSHVNLLPAGWLIKLLSPRTRIIMFAHGIEVWEMPLGFRKYLLGCVDDFLCVSEFTRARMIELHKLPPEKCMVLNNCLDPFLPLPVGGEKGISIRKKLGISQDDFVLFTLTRMKSSERYKGYDRVLEALSLLKDEFPNLKYLIAGKWDNDEQEYISEIIHKNGLKGRVIISGFVEEDTLPSCFKAADVFIMPSFREGFGLVFVEAMYYGLPVIAGDRDGSVDALAGGSLGLLTDPFDVTLLAAAIRKMISGKNQYLPDKALLMKSFGYDSYRSAFYEKLRLN